MFNALDNFFHNCKDRLKTPLNWNACAQNWTYTQYTYVLS